LSIVKVQGNASGTGIFTVAAPNSNTDRTLTLPDATGTVQVSGNPISGTTGSFSGDLSFNSGYGSSAVAYGCRAWVNFNGTGTVAIRASGNVSSITDNGTSDYTVNFTTAMPDANYGISGAAGLNNTSLKVVVQPSTLASPTTTAVRIQVPSADGSLGSDPPIVCVSIFR
jgi:hypothetical protein